jgi:thiol-disulfide isomerase/thioredoxin
MPELKSSIHAPELAGGEWLRKYQATSLAGLRGQVVLLDFWDYTCINCLRTLPYLRAWHARYHEFGLAMIGIHTPEFPFGRLPAHVAAGAGRLGVGWPILLDNHQNLWTAYAVRAWPTLILIDGDGYIRFQHAGEGAYGQIEKILQALLGERNPGLAWPEVVTPVRPADRPGARCHPPTPEIQAEALQSAGAGRDQIFAGAVHAEGEWKLAGQALELTGRRGVLHLTFQASEVHAVLAPGIDFESRSLLTLEAATAEAFLDDKELPPDAAGPDIAYRRGRARLLVDSPRLYNVVDLGRFERHRLTLRIRSPGAVFYAFSFGSCPSEPSPSSAT